MAKNLYHSALCAMNVVTVTVNSERCPSKYSKPGNPKPDYVKLRINGVEFSYSVENEACANFFKGQVGRTFAIKAEGRESAAVINYVGAPASQMQQPPAAQQQQAPPSHVPPPQNMPTGAAPQTQHTPAPEPPPRDWLKETKAHIGQNVAMIKIALEAHTYIEKEYYEAYGEQMIPELSVAVYQSLLYGSSAKGFPQGLPVTYKITAPEAKKTT